MKTNVIFAQVIDNGSFDINYKYDDIKNNIKVLDTMPFDDRKTARRYIYTCIRQLRKVKGLGDAPASMSFLWGKDGKTEITKWDVETNKGNSDMNENTGNAWVKVKGKHYVICRQEIEPEPQKIEVETEPVADAAKTERTELPEPPAEIDINMEALFEEISNGITEKSVSAEIVNHAS